MAKPAYDKERKLLRAEWTEDDKESFAAELQGSSDRAAVLIASAYLDGTLEFAVRSCMVGRPTEGDERIIFGTSGALSSFSVKVRMAYLMGVYGRVTRDDLLIVVSVRNKFAHSAKPLKFSDDAISKFCGQLRAHGEYCNRGYAIPFREGFNLVPDRIKFLSTCLDIERALRIKTSHTLRMRALQMKRDINEFTERKNSGKSVNVLSMKYDGLP